MRNAAQEVTAVQIKIAMITFAVFMIRNIYCKLNSIRGNPLLIERLTDHIYSNTPTKKIKPTGEVADFQEIMDEQRDRMEQKRREMRAEQLQGKTHESSSIGSWVSSIWKQI